LGWQPMISFDQMVEEMMDSDLKLAKRDELCRSQGYDVCNYHE